VAVGEGIVVSVGGAGEKVGGKISGGTVGTCGWVGTGADWGWQADTANASPNKLMR
jgi:hypothetical protein